MGSQGAQTMRSPGLNGAPGPRESQARMGSASSSRPTLRRLGRVWAALCLALGATGCVTYDQEIHLAPLWSDLSMAGGGREREAAAGAIRENLPAPDERWVRWSLRPLVTKSRNSSGDSLMHYLVPLGTRARRGEEVVDQLLPLMRFEKRVDSEGRPTWKFLALPGIFWSKDHTGRIVRAVFPFGGRIEGSFTYESITFALFPLWVRTKREGRTSNHFLWPIFLWSTKPDLPTSWRVWPLYGASHTEFHTRRFWLWPLFHDHTDVGAASQGIPTRRWSLWPLFSRTRRGTFSATSVLWPFFGYSHDTSTGYWAWDGPWPLVRIIRPGDSPQQVVRTRFWPFYSYYNGDGLTSRWYLWPLVNRRHEEYKNGTREAEIVIPFWQRWEREDEQGERMSSWNKLWPVYQRYTTREDVDGRARSRTAFPALNPLWHMPVVDDMYAWTYELYARETREDAVRERSWGGLWRRDRDAFERRAYLTGLWARRVFAYEGARYAETSTLFGLLRWRTREGSFQGFLRPAFPGPGFPVQRSIEPLPPPR